MTAVEQIQRKRQSAGKPSSEQMAAWMFDHGYGYVDQSRFILGSTHFYPSDFLEENKPILERKFNQVHRLTTSLTAHFGLGNSLHYQFSMDANEHKDNHANIAKLKAIVDETHQLFPPKEQIEGTASDSAIMAVSALMRHDGLLPFTQEAILAERDMQPSDKRYFMQFLRRIAPDAVEYAIRAEIPLHLNAYFKDSLNHTSYHFREGRPLEKSPDTCGSNAYHTSSEPEYYTSTLTVGGVSDCRAYAEHVFYHELGHDIFRAKTMSEELSDAVNTLRNMIRSALPDLPLYDTSISTYHDANSRGLISFLTPPVYHYERAASREAEICCNMLALSFGPLEGKKGETLLREHYKDRPEFAEAVIELRDIVRDIFDMRLEALRDKNPLPAELSSAKISR